SRDRRFVSADELAESLRTALAARPDTPPAVRRFLAELDATSSEVGTALIGSVMSVVTMWSFRNNLFSGIVFWALPPVFGMLAALRIGRLTAEARTPLRSGFTDDQVTT